MQPRRDSIAWAVRGLMAWTACLMVIAPAPGQCKGAASCGKTDGQTPPGCSASAKPPACAGGVSSVDLPRYFHRLGPDVTLWYQHVQTLANPEFEGRAPGTRGAALAAEYIEFYFRQYGLEPPFARGADRRAHASARDGKSYRQPLTIAGERSADRKTTGMMTATPSRADSAEVQTENVAAALRGKGKLKDEWIVIGGHYDALGHPPKKSPFYAGGKLIPGADDNASGTAAVLILAQRLAKVYETRGDDANLRSIMFVAFAGEEIGLCGSQRFVEHGPVPADKIHAMLNLDMIGRMRQDTLWLSGVGTAVEFKKLLDPLLRESGLKVISEQGGTGSDHVNFWNAGVPALFFMTGDHEDLHSPGDKADTVNPEGAGRVIDVVEKVAVRLAEHKAALTFAAQPESLAAGCSGGGSAEAEKSGASSGDDKPVALPDTPAGKNVAAFLEAFNSNDDERMRDFEKRCRAASAIPNRSIEDRVSKAKVMRDDLGNLTPLSVVSASATEMAILARSSRSGERWMMTFQFEEQPPHGLISLSITGPASAEMAADFAKPIDEALRRGTIKQLAKVLRETYVNPEVGQRMAKVLAKNEAKGRYDDITVAGDLAQQLTTDLLAVCKDRHLNIRLRTAPSCAATCGPGGDDTSDNYGFRKAEVLPGNIGYIEFNVFRSGKRAQEAAAAALASVADCDALIFDLRANIGGSPGMVQFISSYLFDEPTHLDSVYNRLEDKTTELWTLESVPGKRFRRDLPIYVLTSSLTFSAAEGFTYDLKNLKRVTVVGETTGGGAHMVTERSINDRFLAIVPYARVFNPVTKENWEGIGVSPDIQAPASEALETACKDAARKIGKRR